MKSEEHERVCVNYRTSQHHYQKIFLLINTLIHFHRSLGENIFRRIPHTHSTSFHPSLSMGLRHPCATTGILKTVPFSSQNCQLVDSCYGTYSAGVQNQQVNGTCYYLSSFQL